MSKKGNPPKPKNPFSFQKIVEIILADADFAKFIHGEILKARDGDQGAANLVSEYFRPLPQELKDLKLPREFLYQKTNGFCTSNFLLLDFATPAKIWRK